MGLFDKFKTSTAIDRLSEEKLYEQVAQELKAGKKRDVVLYEDGEPIIIQMYNKDGSTLYERDHTKK